MRHKDVDWNLEAGVPTGHGNTHRWESIYVSLLMDIRDELKALNRVIGCRNFREVPTILRGIRRHIAKPKKKAKAR